MGGRIASVGGAKTYASSLIYASFGGLRSMQYGNNQYEQTCYNSRLQPTAVWVNSTDSNDCANANSTDLLNLQFGYKASPSNNGNLASQTIYAGGPSYAQSYTYTDGLNRLSSATETGGWSQTYVYDSFGNRAVLAGSWVPNSNQTPQTNNTTSVPYNTSTSNNQWTGAQYDPSGNGNVTSDGLNTGMLYDAENRLKSSYNTNDGTVTYSYDGEGRRVQKAVTGGATTTYVYDAQGQLAAEYATSAPPALCATCWFTADHLGSTRMLTDSNGVVQRRYDFLPFGEEIQAGINGRGGPPYEGGTELTTPDSTDDKFTGKLRDNETGLDFFGARYFSGAQGRFTSPDPEGAGASAYDPQSWNMYAYARNNPLIYTDPTGMNYTVCDAQGKNCSDLTD